MIKWIGNLMGVLVLLVAVVVGFDLYSSHKLNEQKNEYSRQIDSLQVRIDSLNRVRTRLYTRIDSLSGSNLLLAERYRSSEVNFNKIKENYDKIRNNLNSYTVDEHIVFFAEHVSPKDSH